MPCARRARPARAYTRRSRGHRKETVLALIYGERALRTLEPGRIQCAYARAAGFMRLCTCCWPATRRAQSNRVRPFHLQVERLESVYGEGESARRRGRCENLKGLKGQDSSNEASTLSHSLFDRYCEASTRPHRVSHAERLLRTGIDVIGRSESVYKLACAVRTDRGMSCSSCSRC